MNVLSQFWVGFRKYPAAWRFLKEHGLMPWLWGTALCNLVLFSVTIWLALYFATDLTDYLTALTGWEAEETGWRSALQVILLFLIRVVFVLICFKVYRYLVLTVMAPVLAFLSEEIQERLTGYYKPFSWPTLWRDTRRGIAIALINFIIEIGLTILLVLVGWVVPLLAPFVPPVIFIVESYFIGFSMLDYRNEFIGLGSKESRRSINRHYGLVLGNGVMFNLMMFVPVIGVLIAPVLSLTAAGLAYNEIDNPENYAYTIQKSLLRKDT
ncbi:EI24 domain-containing protein [Roseivirga sp. BDSF3-8]|uniref:EI24 domain-containing protein n=1 Tax=Roseivirga sp. BDSF3-8 TaxID=3241598 RepID=UPI003531ECF8